MKGDGNLREIHSSLIEEAVSKMCMEANYALSNDIVSSYKCAKDKETTDLNKKIYDILIENVEVAKNHKIPICQDTGMTIVFVELGNEVLITGDLIEDAINKGVAKGYTEGYLRKSVVKDPIDRVNTNDNTPAVIHYKIVKGDKVKITVAPKGFGSENMSAVKMLTPSMGIDGVKDFVIETVKNAGPNPCPPIIVGVGIGGSIEKATLMSKEALLRNIYEHNENKFWCDVEKELLQTINGLKIGVNGLGGNTTAFAVNINTYPTHIAGLPVAVNIGCHVNRHKEVII